MPMPRCFEIIKQFAVVLSALDHASKSSQNEFPANLPVRYSSKQTISSKRALIFFLITCQKPLQNKPAVSLTLTGRHHHKAIVSRGCPNFFV